ncbi:MAG: ion transporter [Lachnospiraceae bacterium]|nr:ion transporter [Lachnospiraceae bacterium]
MRKRLFKIIELSDGNDKLSGLYDIVMMCTIVISLIPLAFKKTNSLFLIVDYITTGIFVADYLLRFITADYKLEAAGNNAKLNNSGERIKLFFIYPFTPMAIIDLLAILPTFSIIASGFKILKLFRLLRTFRVLKIFKIFRYSKSIIVISNVIKKQKEPLLAVCVLAAAYIVICALIIFNVEPDTFDNFFSAVYWATVSLTTMGYGDIYPVSTTGRVVTMLSSFVGIAIVALPAGIITAGYMDEINKE